MRDNLTRVHTAFAQRGERERLVTFGKSLSVSGDHQWNVRPARLALSEQPVQEDLPRRRGEQVRSPQHLRDPHRAVVHHDRELVREDAVAAAEHEVADQLLGIERPVSGDLVVEGERTGWDAQAQRRGARPAALGPLGAGQACTGARIARALVAVRCARRRDLRAGAVTFIHMVAELSQGLLVERGTVRLEHGRTVPVEAEPAELLQLLLCHARTDARSIDVLDADGVSATACSRPQPGEQRRARVSQV